MISTPTTHLLSGDEAVAHGALDAGVTLGTGYPGTPSTEILETFSAIGGRAQWAPNEKVALEVGIGVAFGGGRALVTMKHVGLNVAADPLFTAAYTKLTGPLVIISADDPGMGSSQNEQDNRRFAVAAGVPMLEPTDSQEAYDYVFLALELSQRWQVPFLLRLTTRICHANTLVSRRPMQPVPEPRPFERDIPGRVMIPAYARPAHKRLRQVLADVLGWNEAEGPHEVIEGDRSLGIVTSGISYQHVREAAPTASVLKLGMTYPLPLEAIRKFADGVDRLMVVEEGDPYLVETLNAAGIAAAGKSEQFRFGELTVNRVRRIVAGDDAPEPPPPRGKPPQLCVGCPHRTAFTTLHDLDCIVAGDIGCYTLGVLPPFEAMDTCVCMGASVTVGLGMRHALPEQDAKRVVSVIGDSTFVHSGITGLVEMVYNPPATGHVVLILDNGTTAMTGMQEHPGTGRALNHEPTNRVDFEALIKSLGIQRVVTLDAMRETQRFADLLREYLDSGELGVIIAKRPCLLAAGKIREYEKAAAEKHSCAGDCDCGHAEAEA